MQPNKSGLRKKELNKSSIKNMSNVELRDALQNIRKQVSSIEINSITDIEGEMENLLELEEEYSRELKNRELLEWALRTEANNE